MRSDGKVPDEPHKLEEQERYLPPQPTNLLNPLPARRRRKVQELLSTIMALGLIINPTNKQILLWRGAL